MNLRHMYTFYTSSLHSHSFSEAGTRETAGKQYQPVSECAYPNFNIADSSVATCQIRAISEVLKEEIQIGISSK